MHCVPASEPGTIYTPGGIGDGGGGVGVDGGVVPGLLFPGGGVGQFPVSGMVSHMGRFVGQVFSGTPLVSQMRSLNFPIL